MGRPREQCPALRRACGCRKLCRSWSGGISVLVDESVTAGRSNDLEAPSSPTEAKRQLRALVPILLDEHRVHGGVDLRRVLVPNMVEQHAISFLKDKGPGWCQDTRGLLGRIGRANNPQAWPKPPKRLGAKKVSDPYTSDDEVLWRTIAEPADSERADNEQKGSAHPLTAGTEPRHDTTTDNSPDRDHRAPTPPRAPP